MGAYGGTNEASKTYFGTPSCEAIVAGDINGDCIVDFRDFSFIGKNWLKEKTESTLDIRNTQDIPEDPSYCDGPTR